MQATPGYTDKGMFEDEAVCGPLVELHWLGSTRAIFRAYSFEAKFPYVFRPIRKICKKATVNLRHVRMVPGFPSCRYVVASKRFLNSLVLFTGIASVSEDIIYRNCVCE